MYQANQLQKVLATRHKQEHQEPQRLQSTMIQIRCGIRSLKAHLEKLRREVEPRLRTGRGGWRESRTPRPGHRGGAAISSTCGRSRKLRCGDASAAVCRSADRYRLRAGCRRPWQKCGSTQRLRRQRPHSGVASRAARFGCCEGSGRQAGSKRAQPMEGPKCNREQPCSKSSGAGDGATAGEA